MPLLRNIKNSLRLKFSGGDANTASIMAEAVFASIVLQLTSPFYQFFAKAMGAGDAAIGMISSLPALCALGVLLPLSFRVDCVGNKKQFLMRMILVCGAILPVVAMAPMLGKNGYWFFIIGIALWNIPYISYTITWQSYFSDLFPPSRRSVPYALRMMMTNIVPVVTITACALILSYVCKTNEQKILAYQIFFALAFVASIFQYRAIKRTNCAGSLTCPTPRQKPPSFFATFPQAARELKKNRSFRNFLMLLFVFYFSWQMAWPFFFLYLVNVAGFSEFAKCSADVLSLLAFSLTATFWGKYIQNKGAQPATLWGMLGCLTSPFLTVISTNPIPIFAGYIISGATGPGFQLGLFNDMLDHLPEENKTLNIGIYNTVMQISNFVAPMCGVALGGIIGIRNTMFLSSGLRTMSLVLFGIRFLLTRRREKREAQQPKKA